MQRTMKHEFDYQIRRLPVYILIDCSSSMKGDAIESIDQGFKNIMVKFSNDPRTADIVWFSIIVFDSTARQLIPLCPICDYKSLPLKIGGSTNLGRAFTLLKDCMSKEVKKQTSERRGDKKPLVFLMSDGQATDNYDKILYEIKKDIYLIAFGVGSDVKTEKLERIANHVVLIKDQTIESINELIDYTSSFLVTASQRSTNQPDKLSDVKKYEKIKIIVG